MLELEDQISDAFTADSDEDNWWEPEVSADLLRVTPQPKPIPDELLATEADRYRRILVRQNRGIPLLLLIALGGSLVFHIVLWGGLLLLFLFYVPPAPGNGSGHDPNAGGASGGYMILGDGPKGPPAIANKLPDITLPPIHLPTPKPEPALTPHEEIKPPQPSPPTPIKIADINPIGLPTAPDPLGTIKPTPTPIKPAPAEITPPTQVAMVSPPTPAINVPPTDGGKTAPVAHSPNGGLGDGGDPNDGEPTIKLYKPGSGGDGSGSNDGQGDGIDRGESGADSPAEALNFDFHPDLPPLTHLKRACVAKVEVLPNGRAGKIILEQSCGLPDIDAAYIKYLKDDQHFRPYRSAGATVPSSMTMIYGDESLPPK